MFNGRPTPNFRFNDWVHLRFAFWSTMITKPAEADGCCCAATQSDSASTQVTRLRGALRFRLAPDAGFGQLFVFAPVLPKMSAQVNP